MLEARSTTRRLRNTPLRNTPLRTRRTTEELLALTPEQFEQVGAENREAVLELTAEGRLIQMTPTGSETGAPESPVW